MQQDDVIIVGGGLSGLMLGWWLMHYQPSITLRILERRTHYTHDRHWGFWQQQPLQNSFEQLITHRYPRWDVIESNAHKVHCEGGNYHYSIVPSQGFYDAMQRTLGDHILMNTHCTHVTSHEVLTDAGERFNARMVIDARPPSMTDDIPVLLYQQFSGKVIRSKEPVFDPSSMTLMDFRAVATSQQACVFHYILPFSAHEALIEPTWLTPKPLPASTLNAYCDALVETLAPHHTVLHHEYGCLPLGVKPYLHGNKTHAPYPVGARAGWMRPSSGYSFWQSYKASNQLAKHIVTHASLPAVTYGKYSRSAQWLDAVFLRVASKHPSLLPTIFTAWFKGTAADKMVAFVHDEARWPTIARLLYCTPYKHHFLRQALWAY